MDDLFPTLATPVSSEAARQRAAAENADAEGIAFGEVFENEVGPKEQPEPLGSAKHPVEVDVADLAAIDDATAPLADADDPVDVTGIGWLEQPIAQVDQGAKALEDENIPDLPEATGIDADIGRNGTIPAAAIATPGDGSSREGFIAPHSKSEVQSSSNGVLAVRNANPDNPVHQVPERPRAASAPISGAPVQPNVAPQVAPRVAKAGNTSPDASLPVTPSSAPSNASVAPPVPAASAHPRPIPSIGTVPTSVSGPPSVPITIPSQSTPKIAPQASASNITSGSAPVAANGVSSNMFAVTQRPGHIVSSTASVSMPWQSLTFPSEQGGGQAGLPLQNQVMPVSTSIKAATQTQGSMIGAQAHTASAPISPFAAMTAEAMPPVIWLGVDSIAPGSSGDVLGGSIPTLQTPTGIVPSATFLTGYAGSTAQMVAQQISTALAERGLDSAGTLELTLDPPELGRVRMQMAEVAGAMTLMIHAERPETVELMRRHLEILEREFNDAGLDAPNVQISHGDQGDQSRREDASDPDDRQTADPLLPQGTPVLLQQPNSTGALDLRL